MAAIPLFIYACEIFKFIVYIMVFLCCIKYLKK
ncbi:MAG: hypothetical protein PWP53_4250 [Lacrimispora sp.]|nr:hypothetical protein [Lacrimispora sp.]